MFNCNFVCSFPDYVLDRTIVLEEGHEHIVSGYKLAKYSEFFRFQLKEIRSRELERCKNEIEGDTEENQDPKKSTETIGANSNRRKRTRSISDFETDRIKVPYDDIFGLEYILSFIHCQDNLSYPQLKITENNIISIIRAGLFLKVPTVIEYCFEHIKMNINCTNSWRYFDLVNEIIPFPEIMLDFLQNFILENFIKAAKDEGILNLPYNKLREFLINDKLNCKEEFDLLEIISKWIDFDKNSRLQFTSNLLKCIRLYFLNSKEMEQVSSNYFVKLTGECVDLYRMCNLEDDELKSSNVKLSSETLENIIYMKKPRLPREAIIVVGGWEGNQDDPNFGPSRAIQIYNARSNEWKRIVNDNFSLDEGHAYSGCVLFNNKLYVIGGYISSGPTQTLKAFNLMKKKWKYLSPMHEKRNYISSCCLNNNIYAIGGHNGRSRLNSVEKYDPILNSWSLVAPMLQVRSDAGSDSLGGKLYVSGGFDGHHFYSSVEMYDPVADQWTNVAPMNNIRSGVSVISFGLHLYAIGGNDGLQRLRTVERYDPETNRWQGMPPMVRQRSNFCAAVIENEIYVMGGWSDETNSTVSFVEKWSPGMQNEWQTVRQLYMPASANCCCSISGLDFILDFLNQ